MRPLILTLLALGLAVLPYGCCSARDDASTDFSAFRRYGSSDERLVQGTLTVNNTKDTSELSGITQLADGTCLIETATIDARGWLVRGEAHLAGPNGYAHVVVDAAHGTVDVTAPSLRTRWSVPTDLPWIWNPLLKDGDQNIGLATPLSAVVALRGATAGEAVRALDLRELQSHTVMDDQLVVANDESFTVVLGDDAVEIDHGLPRRIHLAALGSELETLQAPEQSRNALATSSRGPSAGFRNL